MIYILAALLIFGFLIAIHELGHFLAAKICNVPVLEFSIGMGPKIFQKQGKETLYSLRLFPVGGFCAMDGEDEDSDNPRALNHQGFWQKLLIYAAGAAMNFVAGVLIILCLYAGASAFYSPQITGFAPEFSLQGENGLQIGDTIYAIDGERVYLYNDLGLLLSRGNGQDFDLIVLRGGKKVVLKDFPMQKQEYTTSDGTRHTGYGIYFGAEKATLGSKLHYTWYNALDFVRMVRLGLQDLLAGNAGIDDLSGPVGIVSTITQVGEQSKTWQDAVGNIAYLAALIAVNLAVMNLLPLPALDGGKIFFLLINALSYALFRKHIPAKYENYVHIVGLVLLLGLILVVTFHDVLRIFL